MAFTHTANAGVTTPSGTVAGTIAVSGDMDVSLDTTLTSSQTNKECAIAFPYALLKSVQVVSDKALVIKTNSTSAPDTTLTLVANEPFLWNSSMLFPNPFSAADVTKWYLTNGVAAVATVTIRLLKDGTP